MLSILLMVVGIPVFILGVRYFFSPGGLVGLVILGWTLGGGGWLLAVRPPLHLTTETVHVIADAQVTVAGDIINYDTGIVLFPANSKMPLRFYVKGLDGPKIGRSEGFFNWWTFDLSTDVLVLPMPEYSK